MAEQDHVKAFTEAVAEELRAGPQSIPGAAGLIRIPDGHPLAQALKGLIQAGTATPSAGMATGPSGVPPGASVAVDFNEAAPVLAKAIRRMAREGMAAGDVSPNKGAALLDLAAAMERMPAGWLAATLAQVVAVHLAGPEEWQCFDAATQNWFVAHADILSRVLGDAREMAAKDTGRLKSGSWFQWIAKRFRLMT